MEISQFLLPSVQHAQFLSSYQPSGWYAPGPSYSQTGLDPVCDAQLRSSLRYSSRDFTSMKSLTSSFIMHSFLLWFFKGKSPRARPAEYPGWTIPGGIPGGAQAA